MRSKYGFVHLQEGPRAPIGLTATDSCVLRSQSLTFLFQPADAIKFIEGNEAKHEQASCVESPFSFDSCRPISSGSVEDSSIRRIDPSSPPVTAALSPGVAKHKRGPESMTWLSCSVASLVSYTFSVPSQLVAASNDTA